MSLADTAGGGLWNAFTGGRQQAQQEGTANLQNVGALQAILAKAKADQIAQQYRDGMAGATTDEQRMGLAANALGPEGFMKHQEAKLRLDEKVTPDLSPEDEAALVDVYGAAAVEAAKLRKQMQ